MNRYVVLKQKYEKELMNAMANDKTGEGFICDMFYSELLNHSYLNTKSAKDTLDYFGLNEEDLEANPLLKRGLDIAIEQIYIEEEANHDMWLREAEDSVSDDYK